MEQPKMGAAKLLRSKVFWVGDYDYRSLCARAFLLLLTPPTNVVAATAHWQPMHMCRPKQRDRDLAMLAQRFSDMILQCQATRWRVAVAMPCASDD